MSNVSLSALTAALNQAKGAGVVEETFTTAGLQLVVRNLSATEQADTLDYLSQFSDAPSYSILYLLEHVARSLVQVGDASLRDVPYLPSGSLDENGKPVLLERHRYLTDVLFPTWGREVLLVAFQKYNDVMEKADAAAKDGVVFKADAETSEDKLHRLLAEVRGLAEDLPEDLYEAVTRVYGLQPAISQEELSDLREKELAWFKEQERLATQETLPPPEFKDEPEPRVEMAPARAPRQVLSSVDPTSFDISTRTPLNLEAVDVVPGSRSAQIAALESLETDAVSKPAPQALMTSRVFLERSQTASDASESQVVLDTPPQGGLNPRFLALRDVGLRPRSK